MQLIESILVLLVFLQIVFLFIKKKERQTLAFIGLGLLAFHFILGEARWQMLFIYIVETVLIIVYLRKVSARLWLRIIGSFIGLVFTITSTLLAYFLPVFTLPETSGPYTVALQNLYIKTESTEEIITPEVSDKRELMVNIWYPSEDKLDNPNQYLPDVERKGFAKKYGLPEMAMNYLDIVATQNQLNAQPAEGKFPVLIFSPGYYTPASGYLSMIEDVVSQGYIVFNIIHPYETMGAEYPDGRTAFFDNEFSNNNSWNWNDEVAKAVEIIQNSSDANDKREATKTMVKTYGKAIVERWAKDIENVIDKLFVLNESADFFLNGKLNLEQLGTYGHSVGGAAALEAAIFDDRIKAALNLDGAQWGNLMNTPLVTPGALISLSIVTGQPDVNKYIFEKSLNQDFHNLILHNSGHSNFSDIPFMIRLPQLNEAGTVNPTIAAQNTTAFVNVFFRKYLLEEEINLTEWVNSNPYLTQKR